MNSDAFMAAGVHSASASRRRWPLVILILFLPVWSIGLFYRGIWMPDEPREYDIAINMVGDHDFVVPHLAGEPFLEKPPFAYWLQSASLHLLGQSAGAARLPNLLYAVLAALCIGVLAGDLAPRDKRSQAAMLGAVCFGTMFLVLQVQIWLATDAPLLAMTAVALLSTWRLMHAQTWQQQVPWAVALGTSLAAAFLAKNGFGLLVPGLTLLTWLTWEKRLRCLLRWPIVMAAAWFALCAGLWLVALMNRPHGAQYIHTLLWDNLVGRLLPVEVSSGYDLGHRSSHWRFLLLLPIYVLPWTFAWWGAARWSLQELRSERSSSLRSAIRFCISATVPALVVLLLSRTARGVYFAPVLIGGSLLTSLWLVIRADSAEPREQLLRRLTKRTLLILAALIACVAIALTIIVDISAATVAVFLAGAVAMLGAAMLAKQKVGVGARGVVTAATTFLLALCMFEVILFPTVDRVENLASIVRQAAPRLRAGHVALYCADETIRATLDYAAGLRLQSVCTRAEVARLVTDEPDHTFLVEAKPPPLGQRVKELFPALNFSWRLKEPRKALRTQRRVAELERLGLHRLAEWTVPGGRRYALYGRLPQTAAEFSANSFSEEHDRPHAQVRF